EGIETAKQLDALRSIGCRRGQGYFLSRPLPVESLVEYLQAERGQVIPKAVSRGRLRLVNL
ncbi:MAG TPA: hypothetical protein PKM58_10125, partial [Pyrinomonadaceae bacterium]|nr:hypothetical protein [Pyrinomonadaceae bacterium]